MHTVDETTFFGLHEIHELRLSKRERQQLRSACDLLERIHERLEKEIVRRVGAPDPGYEDDAISERYEEFSDAFAFFSNWLDATDRVFKLLPPKDWRGAE